ncbi:MAG: alkaline phosphatase family protein [Acidobacteriota bacterium]
MFRRLVACFSTALLLTALSPGEERPARVILFSWDGAPFWITSRLLEEGKLPHLQRLVREGAWSDGMVSSFPTKTAAAHAMLWTGVYGHASGITGNYLLRNPARSHSRLERQSGYFSHGLKVDPVWVRTARAGLMTYTFHATQSYPFQKALAGLEPAARRKLRMAYGYTGIRVSPAVFSNDTTNLERPQGWSIPEAGGEEARAFVFRAGDKTFHGLFFDDAFDPTEGCDTLGIVEDPLATSFLARVKPMSPDAASRRDALSFPIATTHLGQRLWFSVHLFDLNATASRFLLYRSGAEAVLTSTPDFPGTGKPALEAFAGNAGSHPYRNGQLGPTIPTGGDGVAEDRLVQTIADVVDQIRRQAEPVLRRGDYRLVVLYAPFPDEVAHAFVGYLDAAVAEHDEVLAARLWPKLTMGFELLDGLLGTVMAYAERDAAHLFLVSDHGMAGTSRKLNVNVALERAGLLALSGERSIDLSRTKALLLPLDDASVAVNTEDREGGIVPVDEEPAVMAELRRALGTIKDPSTGQRVVKGLFEPTEKGLVQPGGSTTGDLFLDLAPGYYFSWQTDTDEIVSVTPPEGNHIFLPTRRDMLAICAGWGPRIPSGTRWPRVRSIDIVPTVLDVLGVERPAGLPGRSLIAHALLN